MSTYPLSFDEIQPPGTIQRLTGVRADGLPDGVHTGGAFLTESGEVWKPLDCKPYANADCRVPTGEVTFLEQFAGTPYFPRNWQEREHQGRKFLVRQRAIILELKPDDRDEWTAPLHMLKRDELLGIEQAIRNVNRQGWEIGDEITIGYDKALGEFFIVDLSTAGQTTPVWWADDMPKFYHLCEYAKHDRLVTLRNNARTALHNWKYLSKDSAHIPDRKEYRHIYASFHRPISAMWARGLGEFHHEQAGNWETVTPWSWVITKQPLTQENIDRYELTWGWSKLHPTGDEG